MAAVYQAHIRLNSVPDSLAPGIQELLQVRHLFHPSRQLHGVRRAAGGVWLTGDTRCVALRSG